MKKLFALLTVLFLILQVQAGSDIFNGDVTIDESLSQVVVTYTCTYVDSSDKHHTVPIFIGDMNDADAYASGIVSATGDVNVIYHFSMVDNVNSETATWHTSTPADFDALSSTAVFDSIGTEEGADVIQFHCARWMVVEFAGGGTSNQDGNIVTFIMSFTKDGDYMTASGQPVNVARKANYSYTNP